MPHPHTGIGNENKIFPKVIFDNKNCLYQTNMSEKFDCITWFVLFRCMLLCYFCITVIIIWMQAVHTGPKSILCTNKNLWGSCKQLSPGLTEFIAFRLLAASWSTCQGLETIAIEEPLRAGGGDWITAGIDAACGGWSGFTLCLLPSETLPYSVSCQAHYRRWIAVNFASHNRSSSLTIYNFSQFYCHCS